MPRAVAIRFCVVFVVLVGFYATVYWTRFVEQYIHTPMSRLVVRVSSPVLSVFGETAFRGTRIEYEGFVGIIVDACNGVLPIYLFLAAVVAFPSRWREKLSGAVIGIASIFLVNIVRVVSLMMIGSSRPDIVEWVHIHVWQTLIVILAMAIWVFWAERFASPRLAVRH